MIDHASKALRLIEQDNTSTLGWETADAQHLSRTAEAQVHATLAVAEQMRVSNLLAAAALVQSARCNSGKQADVDGWAIDSDAEIHSALADDATWRAFLGAEVARKRGLAQ